LNSNEGGRWAKALEGRDDVDLEERYCDLLKDSLFELGSRAIGSNVR
jgi:hypothetical protein